MPRLYDPVSVLPGIGAVVSKALLRSGVKTLQDLLWYLPFRYENYATRLSAGHVRNGDVGTLVVELVSIEARKSHKSALVVTEAIVKDETGELTVKWFNQPFLVKTLRPGAQLSLAGEIQFRGENVLINPRYEMASEVGESLHTGRIVPIYPRSAALGEKRLRSAMRVALEVASRVEDPLPVSIQTAESFPSLVEALWQVHFPTSLEARDRAVERLKFDELFLHQLLFARVKDERTTLPALPVPIDEEGLKATVATLPFALTDGQRRAAWDIVQDLAKPHPMNRLLQGDVGSGKTAVAAIAIASVLRAGLQAAYLAPTDLLAKQQSTALQTLLPGHQVALLTRTDCRVGGERVTRPELLERLKTEPLVLVATHAVLEEMWSFRDLALVVVDEQHRFGVRQRHALLARSENAPHLLSMSATPIPRSLALTVYGDLECSTLQDRPAGRKPIETRLVFEREEADMYAFILHQVKEGARVYIVCPLIDPSDALGASSVSELAKRLRKGVLKDVVVGELHGKMKPGEKEDVMQAFRSGQVPVLVSTTVVEVGVDVPEATVMVIEGAERFGLAQLHQLRGRVGRSDRASYCFLRPGGFLQGTAKDRLVAMTRSQNGFELAELDLKFRGPGNVFGDAQSGFPDFQLATLADVDLMGKARAWSEKLLLEDPELETYPLLRDRLKDKTDHLHLE